MKSYEVSAVDMLLVLVLLPDVASICGVEMIGRDAKVDGPAKDAGSRWSRPALSPACSTPTPVSSGRKSETRVAAPAVTTAAAARASGGKCVPNLPAAAENGVSDVLDAEAANAALRPRWSSDRRPAACRPIPILSGATLFFGQIRDSRLKAEANGHLMPSSGSAMVLVDQ